MPKTSFLTEDAFESIHNASLNVLENGGVLVKNQKALNLLKNSGCGVDLETNLIKIPSDVVEDSIKKAPSSFELYNREGDKHQTVGKDNVIYNPGSAAIYFLDRDTGEMRRADSRDLSELVRLVDALKYIKAQSTAVVPSDVDDEIADLYRLYVILKNSSKPIITGAFSKQGFLDMKGMLESVVGGEEELRDKPRAIFDCCPSSPLMWSDITCQNLIDCAISGTPAEIIPAPQIGATSPVTIAGTLVQSAAEFLSGVVISQLSKQGAPIIFGGSPSAFDMRYCTARLGAMEAMISACAAVELGKYYDVPTQAYLGLSDSKTVDAQSGFESGLGIALAALSRINIVSGPGMLACENCQSLEKLVIDNELCGSAYRLIDEIDMQEDAPATDLILRVGAGGHFLGEKHTRQFLNKERFMPSEIICRLSPDAWKKSDTKNTIDRAREAVNRILKEHKPRALSSEADESLEDKMSEILKRRKITRSELPNL